MNYIERYWRDAKPEDAIKEPPMVARFRQDAQSSWHFGSNQRLTGVDRDDDGTVIRWFSNKTSISFCQCQVYDAPDPGEGWRLIDPDKDDYRQDGVEYWNRERQEWAERLACKHTPFQSLIFYRIRITPAVTYVPFTWEDREQLRGRWITRDNREVQITCLSYDKALFINGMHAEDVLKYWKFLDTGKAVGKEVTQ